MSKLYMCDEQTPSCIGSEVAQYGQPAKQMLKVERHYVTLDGRRRFKVVQEGHICVPCFEVITAEPDAEARA